MCEKADKKKDLQEIVEVASAIILQLGGNDDDANNRMEGENTCFSTDFSFTNNYCKTFMESIGSFKLSKTTVVALLEIFKQKSLQLKQHCEESFRNLTKRLSCTPGGINGDLSVNYVFQIWQNNLEEHTRKLKEMLILSIENKIRSFNKEVETVSDIESSDESSVAQKGHSPRAVAILEKVFSLTPNINRSEKHQLAKATKLEPRQVTIWFQNRRNRKPTSQIQPGTRLQNQTSGVPRKRKRKSDEMVELVPQTPKLRRRMSESGTPSSFKHDTPHSTSTRGRSSSVELFEASLRSIGGTSCGTSYDDNFSSYQSATSSPPRSTFGLNSFDDQIVRFTNAKKKGSSSDHSKEMMFNENGELLLDWDDLELKMDDFDNSLSSAVTPSFTFPTNNQHNAITANLTLPNSTQETNDLIQTFARQLVEEHFDAQQSLNQVQQSEGWNTPVIERLFLSKDADQDVISLADVQSSQNSNPSGPSTTTSTQTSPRSNTPKSLFDFDFDNLGLDEVMAYNNETIVHQVDAIDLHEMEELLKFDPLTTDMLGLILSPPATSTNANNDTSSLTLLH